MTERQHSVIVTRSREMACGICGADVPKFTRHECTRELDQDMTPRLVVAQVLEALDEGNGKILGSAAGRQFDKDRAIVASFAEAL